MATKPDEMSVEDIKMVEYNGIGKGVIKLDNEDLSFFEKETWKLFVSNLGWIILDKEKDRVSGECIIQFFPVGKEKLIESAKKTNKTFLAKTLIKPLFFIKYDSNLNIEFVKRSGEKIPKDIFFLILCR